MRCEEVVCFWWWGSCGGCGGCGGSGRTGGAVKNILYTCIIQ